MSIIIKQKTLNNFERYVSNSNVTFGVYSTLMLLTIILYVFFGIVPMFNMVISKGIALNEMKNIDTQMTEKIALLKTTDSTVKYLKKDTKYLDKYISIGGYTQDYLLSLLDAASSAGFSLREMVTPTLVNDEADQGYVLVKMSLDGEGDHAQFIEQVEKMKYLASIESLQIFAVKDTIDTYLTVRIYGYTK